MQRTACGECRSTKERRVRRAAAAEAAFVPCFTNVHVHVTNVHAIHRLVPRSNAAERPATKHPRERKRIESDFSTNNEHVCEAPQQTSLQNDTLAKLCSANSSLTNLTSGLKALDRRLGYGTSSRDDEWLDWQ